MLALTHHALVQFAAQKIGVTTEKEWFGAYAILGDDIVIAHDGVAREYLNLMSSLSVGINLSKSLLSPKGLVMEFAKRTT
jgi:hypothetical protein